MPADSAAIAARLAALQQRRADLDAEIASILAGIAPSDRPLRTCLRCGHQWRSFSYLRLPRSCARCGSTYWNDEPVAPGARHPEDPPNPRWRKRTVPRKRAFPPASITAASPVERHVAAQRAGLTPPPPLPQALASPPPAYVPPRVEAEPQPESYAAAPQWLDGDGYGEPAPQEMDVAQVIDVEMPVIPNAELPVEGLSISEAEAATGEVTDPDAWLAARDARVAAILAGQPDAAAVPAVPEVDDADHDA